MPLTDLQLMAHLFRRAGFGATRDDLEAALDKGYAATVEELLHPEDAPEVEEETLYHMVWATRCCGRPSGLPRKVRWSVA